MYRHWIAPMAVFLFFGAVQVFQSFVKCRQRYRAVVFLLEVTLFYFDFSAPICLLKGNKFSTSFFSKV